MNFDFTKWRQTNPWLKLLAFFIALAVWYLGSSEVYVQGRVRVPLVVTAPEGYTVVSINPDQVEIEVDYPRDDVRAALEDVGIRVVHQLEPGVSPGALDFALTAADVEVPPRFRIKLIEPSRVQVQIDRVTEKVLTVKAILAGEPRPGYRLDSVNLSPPEVNIIGPAGILGEMTEIRTAPIRIAGRAASFNARVLLEPIPGAVKLDPDSIGLYLSISRQHKVRRFSGVPVRVMSSAGTLEGVALDPAEVIVFIEGPEEIIDAVVPPRIGAYVEVMDLAPGAYELPVRVSAPSGTNLQKAEPNVIRARIEPSLAPRL